MLFFMLDEFYCVCGCEKCSYVCVLKRSRDDSCFSFGMCDDGLFFVCLAACSVLCGVVCVFFGVYT
jgi:hypothetical protein